MDVLGKPIPGQLIRAPRSAAAAEIRHDHMIARTDWSNASQTRTMVGTAPVEHYDRTTTALLPGVKPNSGSLIPELLHHGLLARAYVGEIFPKNENPAPEDAGFLQVSKFRIWKLRVYVPSSQDAR
jgi:hypothetical protein